jgi:WD40 repeat protein
MAPSAMTEIVARAGAHGDAILSVAYSPDGTKIVSASSDKTIKVWDAGAFWAPNRPSLAKTHRF